MLSSNVYNVLQYGLQEGIEFVRAIMHILKQIYKKIRYRIASTSKKKYIDYLREQGVHIGENCTIYPGASFGSEPYLISIGDHVTITATVQFITHDGGVEVLIDLGYEERPDKFGAITIDNNVFVGMGSIILPNVHIGSNVIIGAGSIVTKDIPDNSVAVGNPARVIKTIDEYYQKTKDSIISTKYLSLDEKKRILLEGRMDEYRNHK